MYERAWLQTLEELMPAYPALAGLLSRIKKLNESRAQRLVRERTRKHTGELPGRCALLIFHEDHVEDKHFNSPQMLVAYMEATRLEDKKRPDNASHQHRLWILEDLEPEWVEVLGGWLHVDPLVFNEQMNTFNFTDSQTIQTRPVPSMARPATSFTLRYFEFRHLKPPLRIHTTTNQMTFAINSRRIERWRDVDTPSFKQKWQHSYIRRCASFWTNQSQRGSSSGWDAVILVDPAYDAMPWDGYPKDGNVCTILQDPTVYSSLDTLWAARAWDDVVATTWDTSSPYHGASHTLTDETLYVPSPEKYPRALQRGRRFDSMFDELVIHWTELADKELIASARQDAGNSALFLLRYLAVSWRHLLELTEATVAQSEYLAHDYEANIEMNSASQADGTENSAGAWRQQLREIAAATRDMNYLRRQMNHFESHMVLNLERLGVGLGWNNERPTATLPQAIQDAQLDFVHLSNRLRPHVARVVALRGTANELASLQATFKSLQDSERGLALSVFAGIVFPATLIASIMSMGGDFLPGGSKFWVFWAVTVPCVSFVVLAIFGRRLWGMLKMMTAKPYATIRKSV